MCQISVHCAEEPDLDRKYCLTPGLQCSYVSTAAAADHYCVVLELWSVSAAAQLQSHSRNLSPASATTNMMHASLELLIILTKHIL